MKINYLSDFKLIESTPLPDNYTTFRFRFYTSPISSYEASFDGTEYSNCRVDDDGRLLIIFDNHNLSIGELYVTRQYYLNDSDFNDGVCKLVSTEKTEVELTSFASTDTTSTIVVSPNYQCGLSAYEIAVKNGYVGTEAEWIESLSGSGGSSSTPVVVDFDSSKEALKPNVHYIHKRTNVPMVLDLEEPTDPDALNIYSITIPIVVPNIHSILCTSEIEWVGCVSASGAPAVAPGNTYEISILNGRGIIVGWAGI